MEDVSDFSGSDTSIGADRESARITHVKPARQRMDVLVIDLIALPERN